MPEPLTRADYQAQLEENSASDEADESPTSPRNRDRYSAAKAYVGAAIAALSAGVAVLYTALDDNALTWQEGVGIGAAMLVSLSTVFGGVYITTNRKIAN